MSLLDGDYTDIEPTVEDLNDIDADPELVNLFDEEEYEVTADGIAAFSSYVYYEDDDSFEDCDLSYIVST